MIKKNMISLSLTVNLLFVCNTFFFAGYLIYLAVILGIDLILKVLHYLTRNYSPVVRRGER